MILRSQQVLSKNEAIDSNAIGHVKLHTPSRLKNSNGFEIFAVYAREINAPEGCEAVELMLLTTVVIKNITTGDSNSAVVYVPLESGGVS